MNRVKSIKLSMGIVATVVIAGCVSTEEENVVGLVTNKAYVVDLPKADLMPSKERLRGKRAKVFVLPVQTTGKSNFEKDAARQIDAKIENSLLTAGVDVVDRSLTATRQINSEIQALEMTGSVSKKGLKVSDVVLKPKIMNVKVVSTYQPARKDYLGNNLPASCEYESNIIANVRIYELPSLTVIDNIPMEATAKTTGPLRYYVNRNCRVHESIATQMADMAATDAIEGSLHEMQNRFAGSGFVLAYRQRENDHFVQISLGSAVGLKGDHEIEFKRRLLMDDPTGDAKVVNELPYDFKGKVVANLINERTAWVKVPEESKIAIQKGDIARIVFDANNPLTDWLKKLN